MLVNVTVKEKKEVDISDEHLLSIVNKYLRAKLNVKEGAFINKDGELVYECEVGCGAHSFFEESKVRDATDIDKALFMVLNTLNT